MSDFYLKESHLHGIRSIGQHMVGRARENGGDTAKPLAFVGLVTMALGATMLMKAQGSSGKLISRLLGSDGDTPFG